MPPPPHTPQSSLPSHASPTKSAALPASSPRPPLPPDSSACRSADRAVDCRTPANLFLAAQAAANHLTAESANRPLPEMLDASPTDKSAAPAPSYPPHPRFPPEAAHQHTDQTDKLPSDPNPDRRSAHWMSSDSHAAAGTTDSVPQGL